MSDIPLITRIVSQKDYRKNFKVVEVIGVDDQDNTWVFLTDDLHDESALLGDNSLGHSYRRKLIETQQSEHHRLMSTSMALWPGTLIETLNKVAAKYGRSGDMMADVVEAWLLDGGDRVMRETEVLAVWNDVRKPR